MTKLLNNSRVIVERDIRTMKSNILCLGEDAFSLPLSMECNIFKQHGRHRRKRIRKVWKEGFQNKEARLKAYTSY